MMCMLTRSNRQCDIIWMREIKHVNVNGIVWIPYDGTNSEEILKFIQTLKRTESVLSTLNTL